MTKNMLAIVSGVSLVAAGAAGALLLTINPKRVAAQARPSAAASDSTGNVGHLYMQTNETQNRIMHFGRKADGKLKLLGSVPTGGAGSGVFKRSAVRRARPTHSRVP